MLQLVYVSSVVGRPNVADILAVSRRNNAHAGLTGLLYGDDQRFMQVLEGPEDAVEAAYARIKTDPRHCAAVILSRRTIEEREFGPWEMAARAPGEEGDAFVARVEQLVANASLNVRATFEGFVQVRAAA
jgi:hypothetical protein